MKYNSEYKTALAAGVIAGMRSFSAPAYVARKRGKGGEFLWALARLEQVADKLPFAPSRLQPPSLIARSASGAVSAVWASDAKSRDEKWKLGLIGAGAAVATSFAAYYLRREIGKRLKLKDYWVGTAEDALMREIGRRAFKAA